MDWKAIAFGWGRAVNEANARADAAETRMAALAAQLAAGAASAPSLPLNAALAAPVPANVEQLRWMIIHGYGFTAAAADLLAAVPITAPLDKLGGGGLTYSDHIELNGYQHEAALHEMTHWVWERTGLQDALLVARLKADYRRMAAGEGALPNVAAYAKVQLDGDGARFPGVLALNDDDHLFVSLASYVMGQYRTGLRALPPYMWPYFEPHFTGYPLLKPYYEEGGRP